MTPREAAARLVREKFEGTGPRITFEHHFILMDFVASAIEQDRAANAPLIAAAEEYREAWRTPARWPALDNSLAKAAQALCIAARVQSAPPPTDFSKEPWNV
jgi:hypothetical protein